MSPRTRNALIGLAVGLGCAAFIIVGVYQASAPSPTTVRFVNAGADAVVLRLNEQINAALKSPTVTQAFETSGIVALPGTPASFSLFLGGEIDKYERIISAARITLD